MSQRLAFNQTHTTRKGERASELAQVKVSVAFFFMKLSHPRHKPLNYLIFDKFKLDIEQSLDEAKRKKKKGSERSERSYWHFTMEQQARKPRDNL